MLCTKIMFFFLPTTITLHFHRLHLNLYFQYSYQQFQCFHIVYKLHRWIFFSIIWLFSCITAFCVMVYYIKINIQLPVSLLVCWWIHTENTVFSAYLNVKTMCLETQCEYVYVCVCIFMYAFVSTLHDGCKWKSLSCKNVCFQSSAKICLTMGKYFLPGKEVRIGSRIDIYLERIYLNEHHDPFQHGSRRLMIMLMIMMTKIS